MRILLTGGRGFIGRHLKAHLGLRHEVYAPTSAELGLLDPQAVDSFIQSHPVDAIVHSACIGVKCAGADTTQDASAANITMYRNLERHSSAKCRIINLGSGAEYDKRRPLRKIPESAFGECIPADPYGKAKYEISRLIARNEHATNLRLFGVYGPGEKKERFITAAALSHLHGEVFHMNRDAVFDFLEITDCCRAVENILMSPPVHRQLNICPTQSARLTDLVALVAKITGRCVPIHIANEGMAPEYTGDNALFLQEYRDFTFTPIEQGVRRLVASLV